MPKYAFPNAKSYVANNFAAVGKAISLVGMGIHRVLVHVFDVGTNRVAWLAAVKIMRVKCQTLRGVLPLQSAFLSLFAEVLNFTSFFVVF